LVAADVGFWHVKKETGCVPCGRGWAALEQ